MDTLVLKLKVLQLSFKSVLGLLSGCNLLVDGFNGFLGFNQPDREFLLAALQLINAAKTLSLKLGSPELNFSLGLRQSLKSIRFLLRLFFNSLPQIFKLVDEKRIFLKQYQLFF
jgi:hypothetical protein